MATELSEYQKDILIRTALGEARGEGVEGMADVIQVILNRANSGEFPSDPAAAALQHNEFSAWNSTSAGGNNPGQFSTNSDTYKSGRRALELVLSGNRPDYTGGALFYKTPDVKSPFHDSQNKYGTIERNGHLYYPTRPVPPGEIPNVVASLQDTTPPPRVAPNPATISPDLSLMRNPNMSSSARMAQVTPPLPQPRPVSPMDIARAPGTTVATIPTSMRPGQSQIERITPMPSARDIAMAPGQTIATIPTSGIGQPPATRTVPSVPYTLQPTAREIAQAPGTTIATIPTTGRPNASQINDAARRASLTNTQSNVERALPPIPSIPSVGSSAANINAQRAEQLGQRVATTIPARLTPGNAAQAYDVSINGPAGLTRQQFAALPLPAIPSVSTFAANTAPTPRPANARPMVGSATNPVRIPQGMAVTSAMLPQIAAAQNAGLPLRAVVNGANSYRAPPSLTPIQAFRAQGYSRSAAYEAANASARGSPTVEDRVRGETSSGDGNRLIAMELDPAILASLYGSGGYRIG